MPGYQDRENAAAKLASEVPVGESSGDDDEDNNGEPPLLDVATGAKTKTSSRSSAGIHPAVEKFLFQNSKTAEQTEQLLVESMNSREEFQEKHLRLVEKKNELADQRNRMMERFINQRLPEVKEVSVMDNSKPFPSCIELRDIQQITEDVAEYMGIQPQEIKGLLRFFVSNVSTTASNNGQLVNRASQLFTENQITLQKIWIDDNMYIQFNA